MSTTYTLIVLKPSYFVRYTDEVDYRREELLVEHLNRQELEDRVAELGCKLEGATFLAFIDADSAQSLVNETLRERVAPVLAQRAAEKEARTKAEYEQRQTQQRAKDFEEYERLRKRLSLP